MSANFNMSFKFASVPEPSEEDIFLLAESIRKIIDLSIDDMMGILEADQSGGTSFSEYVYKVMDMASDIITDALDLEDVPEDEIIMTIRESYALFMRELLSAFKKDVIEGDIYTSSSDGYDPYYGVLEERLEGLLNSTALRISRAALMIQQHTPFNFDQITPEAFRGLESVNADERNAHAEYYELFEPYLTVHDEEVFEFIDNEEFSEDMLDGLFGAPEVVTELEGLGTKGRIDISSCGKKGLEGVRSIFREEYNAAIKASADLDPSALNDIRQWGSSIRQTMKQVLTDMSIAAQYAEFKPIGYKPVYRKGLS